MRDKGRNYGGVCYGFNLESGQSGRVCAGNTILLSLKVSRGSLVKTNKSWCDYYSMLLNRKPNNVNLSFDRFVQSYLSTHDRNCSICSGEDSSDYHELLELNKDFTDTEFQGEINQAPNGKAHGVDSILNEAIKAAKDKLVPL